MTTEDFLKMMLDERIKMLLSKKPSEDGLEVEEAGEKVIMGLEEEKKDKLEAYMDLLTENMAQNERKAYIGGMKDGIRVMKALEEMTDDDFWKKVVHERIQVLLLRSRKKNDSSNKIEESFLEKLDPEARKIVEDFVDYLTAREVNDQEMIYIGGFEDAMRLTGTALKGSFC